jgi:hypothetical protein
MSSPSPTRFSFLALASALFGLLCVTGPVALFLGFLALASALFGLLFVTGPIALLLGWLALRAINMSDGRLRGRPPAVFGLVAGAVGVVVMSLGTLAIALNAGRANGQRVECENNLRQIALAVNVYADHSGHKFPSAVLPLTGPPPEDRLSWLAGILPYLEERPDRTPRWKPLASGLDLDRTWNDPANLPVVRTNVPRFLCPGHPRYDPLRNPGLTHYVGITGLGDDAATLPAEDPRAGFFGYDRVIRQEDIKAGSTNTLMTTETTLDNGPWAAGGSPTVRGVDPDLTVYIGPGRPFGGCHRDGRHDVLTAGYVDGSVRFVTSAIDPLIFRNSARIGRVPDGK